MFGQYKGWILCILTMVCFFVPRSIAFVPLIPGLIGYAVLSWRRHKPLPFDRTLALFFAVIVGLIALSSLWAIDADKSISRALSTGGIFLGGLVLFAWLKTQQITGRHGMIALFALYCLTGLYIFIEYQTDFSITTILMQKPVNIWDINRSLVVYMVLFIPVFFMATKLFDGRRKYLALCILALCALGPYWEASSQTAQMTTIGAVSSFVLLRLIKAQQYRKIIFILTFISISAAVLASPLIPAPLMKIVEEKAAGTNLSYNANMPGRVEIWTFVADHIKQKPLLGHGIEATRYFKADAPLPYSRATSFLHPHNAYLQIWVETGLVGALLACALIALLLRRIAVSDPADQPLYFAVFSGMVALLSTGYGLWQGWQLGLLLASAALCMVLTRIQKP